jgi:hypothetical protein
LSVLFPTVSCWIGRSSVHTDAGRRDESRGQRSTRGPRPGPPPGQAMVYHDRHPPRRDRRAGHHPSNTFTAEPFDLDVWIGLPDTLVDQVPGRGPTPTLWTRQVLGIVARAATDDTDPGATRAENASRRALGAHCCKGLRGRPVMVMYGTTRYRSQWSLSSVKSVGLDRAVDALASSPTLIRRSVLPRTDTANVR